MQKSNLLSLLPDKKKTFPSEEQEDVCKACNVKKDEDIPEDIMEATRYFKAANLCLVKKNHADHISRINEDHIRIKIIFI